MFIAPNIYIYGLWPLLQDAYGYTALHYAKTARAAKALCAAGADFNLTDKIGNTPLQHHMRNPANGDAVRPNAPPSLAVELPAATGSRSRAR